MQTRALATAVAMLIAYDARAQAPRPEELAFEDGVATIPDRETYERLSHRGDAGRDAYLNGIQFVKFQLEGAGGDDPRLYFMNTKTRQAHPRFMRDLGIGGGGFGGRGRRGQERAEEPAPGAGRQMRGAIAYRPLVRAPDGTAGTYTFDFQPNDSFSLDLLLFCYRILLDKAPFLDGKLVYHPLQGGLARYEREKADYEKAGLPVYLDEQLDTHIAYLPMNPGTACGRLRKMSLDELPGPRDIVLYETLPNELTRVAGMVSGVRQTPLSHVNLRAIQDRVPHAFVADAATDPTIQALVGKQVRFVVRLDGCSIREATPDEVAAHFAAQRPAAPQSPPLDLTVTEIRPLGQIKFGDVAAFGAKTANLAALLELGLPDGMVPDGFGVPFSFYREFLAHNGLDRKIEALLDDAAFREGRERQSKALAELRAAIAAGKAPDRMARALAELQRSFPPGTPIRCRSSTNNEDLSGFSGAGLYDSFTHAPDAGHLAATVQKVFASLWNDRAFEEREFWRIDHRDTAMGVLVLPSYRDERANGVAVTLDVLYQQEGYSYVNAQVGEDMVTNPQAHSIPEEILLPWRRGRPKLMQASNRVPDGRRVLDDAHLEAMKPALEKIHDEFAKLYGKEASDPRFAMEVEFKITKDGALAIKQARPWIFASEPAKDGR
jgi:hypothetical protein